MSLQEREKFTVAQLLPGSQPFENGCADIIRVNACYTVSVGI